MRVRSAHIPVSQAAKELGVSRQRIMQRLSEGSLKGEKVGHQWLVLRNSLVHGAPARPLSPRMGWALVHALADGHPQELHSSEKARLRERIDRLRSLDPEASAALLAAWLKPRAERVPLEVHADDISEMRKDERLVSTGVSDPRAGLSSGSELEAYIGRRDLAGIARDYFIDIDSPPEAPNVLLRVMSDASWEQMVVASSHAGGAEGRLAPIALSIADLVERAQARELRAAREMVGRLWR